MVKAWEAARRAARKAQEATYEGLCTVIEYQDVTDPVTKRTHEEEVPVLENQPCKLSFEKLEPAAQSETAASILQGTKLFLAPEVRIKPGSKLVVTQNDVTGEYAESGEPAIYATHQEIMLKLWEGWA